ncbi:MAG: S9 family peptidase [Calditrichaeota bacterium]|nr:S9 family peptidase [Calditrichota bacterium]
MSRLLSILLLIIVLFGQITVEKIYGDGAYSTRGYGPVKWFDDGAGYTTLERSGSDGRDILLYDSENGKREVLIAASELIPRGEDKPLEIRDYDWTPDKRKLIIFTNTRRVWRAHTRGDYWVYDRDSKKLIQLGKSVERTTMMFCKLSPDGKRAAYVSKQNIYVEDIATGKINQITKDGGDNIINGTFDWLYEEELGNRDGFRWSPDSKWISYWQLDTKGTGTFYMINNIDSLYAFPIPLPYPKVGTTNSSARIGVISANGGKTSWAQIPGDPRNHYLARMDWADNSNEILVQQLNRLQNTNRLFMVNIKTGKADNFFTEQTDSWVNMRSNDLNWYDNGKKFTWVSERDGWRHLYEVSRDGKSVKALTKGDYDVISILNIDLKGGYVYYIAAPDKPIERYLYRSPLDGSGAKERLTPSDMAGYHRYDVSPNAKFAVHTFSDSETPNTIDFVSLPDHKQLRMLQDNADLKARLAKEEMSKKEFFRVDIGDIELDAFMIKPPDFNAKKKYPVIFFVYGEPAGQTVQNSWGGSRDMYHRMLAQKGYIVMSVDNRGTASPRGYKWRSSIYKQIGILASYDQEAAAKKIMQMYSFVDPERIGVWGWSGGGSMTLNCMFRFPDLYKTGISVAPVSDQRFYDSCYQERYMSTPDLNPDGFKNGSPINFANGLKGNLFLIHGTGDDNVHYQNSAVLINELIKLNKQFKMFAYPMRSHGIYERENTTRHMHEMMRDYWLEKLPAGGR